MTTCAHLTAERAPVLTDPPDARACTDCLREGTRWVHLRTCLDCGHVGCCDNSPERHATAHFAQSQHPVIASAEPGETWRWCYVDSLLQDGA